MSLTTKQYTCTLFLQHILLIFDIGVNSFSTFAVNNQANLLLLFIIQDFCLIISLTILLANIFSTYIFQAGLIQLLFLKFRMTLIICVFYIALSISFHSWHMSVYYSFSLNHFWSQSYQWLYSLHRTIAVLYYCLIKKASLDISNPKFHKGSKWIERQFSFT